MPPRPAERGTFDATRVTAGSGGRVPDAGERRAQRLGARLGGVVVEADALGTDVDDHPAHTGSRAEIMLDAALALLAGDVGGGDLESANVLLLG